MRVESLGTLLRSGLHGNLPASLKRFLKQRRQHLLKCRVLQMIEQDFGHRVPASSRTVTKFAVTLRCAGGEAAKASKATARLTASSFEACNCSHLRMTTTVRYLFAS